MYTPLSSVIYIEALCGQSVWHYDTLVSVIVGTFNKVKEPKRNLQKSLILTCISRK